MSLKSLAPWAPSYVVQVIDRAAAKDLGQRFASASELRDALTTALAQLEGEVGPGEPLATLVAELRGHGPAEAVPVGATVEVDAAFTETEDADTLILARTTRRRGGSARAGRTSAAAVLFACPRRVGCGICDRTRVIQQQT